MAVMDLLEMLGRRMPVQPPFVATIPENRYGMKPPLMPEAPAPYPPVPPPRGLTPPGGIGGPLMPEQPGFRGPPGGSDWLNPPPVSRPVRPGRPKAPKRPKRGGGYRPY